jgi:hypothetical protein
VSAGRWRRQGRRGGGEVDPVLFRQYVTERFRKLLAGQIERCLANDPADTALLLEDVVDFYMAERAAGRVPYSIKSSTEGQRLRDEFLQRWLVGFEERMLAQEAAAAGPSVPPTE